MSLLKVESDSLHLSDPSRSRSSVHVAVSHPTPLEEAAFGKLYLVTEIDSTERINQDIVVALQDELRATYYRSSDLTVEAAFENALQAGNKKLHDFISNGVTAWVDNFHAVVAVVKNDVMTMSTVGRMNAFLFRGNKITDITESGTRATERRNPLKMFSSVLTGRAAVGDRLLLCTSSLLDFFSQEKLKRLIVEDLPSGTLARIEHALLATPTPVSFGAILFAFLPEQSSKSVIPDPSFLQGTRTTAPQRSMEELVAKERATEQLLSPKMMPNVRATLSSGWQSVSGFLRTRILKRPPRRRVAAQYDVRDSSRFQAPPLMQERRILRSVGRGLSRFLLILLALPRWIGSLIAKRPKVDSHLKDIPTQTTGTARKAVTWARSLTPVQGILFLGIIVGLFILSQTVIASRSNKQTVLRGNDLTAAIAKINDNVDKASAALTYDDTAGAQKLISEASDLIAKLPNSSKSDKTRVADLQHKLDGVRQIARHVVTPTLTTVSDDAAIAAIKPTGLALVGTTLVIGGSTENQTLKVALDGTTTKLSVTIPASTFAVGLDTQSVILGGPSGSARQLNSKTGAVRDLTLKFPNTDHDVTAATTFQSRLYLLDTKNNAILRSLGGSTLTQWLKDSSADIRKGIAIAIDGDIYVVTSDGAIKRFASGFADSATFTPVDPALSSPTAAWTSDTASALYILEPSQNRIVMYLKSSRVPTKQFVHDEIKQAVAFSVDSRNNIIYILTPTKLLKFSAT